MNATIPEPLETIVNLLEDLPEQERREVLVHYAAQVDHYAPSPSETYEVSDVRHDEKCIDSVGIFVFFDDGCHFRVSLGEKVQTLTRAISSILCQSLENASPAQVALLPESCIDRMVGAELVRQRSQTVYYILERMKEAIQRCHRHSG